MAPCRTWGKGAADGLVTVTTQNVTNWGDGTFIEPEAWDRTRVDCHLTSGEWAKAYHPDELDKLGLALAGVTPEVLDLSKGDMVEIPIA